MVMQTSFVSKNTLVLFTFFFTGKWLRVASLNWLLAPSNLELLKKSDSLQGTQHQSIKNSTGTALYQQKNTPIYPLKPGLI
jgi:hypothetical protein